MASSLHEVIASLSARISDLERAYGREREANARLQAEVEALRADLRQQASELERERADKVFLAVSHRLASEPEEIVSARRRIAKMISDIDKCISQLKE